jgi:glycerate dehydrogenase
MNPPSIVILDGHTLNPGDLSWSPFEELGKVTSHDRTSEADVLGRAKAAEVLIVNKTPLTARTIAALPNLRYIGVLATGYNIVDTAAARARGIPVTNVPVYGTDAVAQHVFALLLELTQHVGHHAAAVREGRWSRSADWCFWDTPLVELAGRQLGLVGGAGRIGRAVAQIGEAFRMSVAVAELADGPAKLETVFRRSDVISLHCPLTPETQDMVNARTLGWMKPTAFLINTSRGPLVNDRDLAEALNAGRIAGAGLDVLSVEPPPPDNPLLAAKNSLVTPHLAWAPGASRGRLLAAAAANLRAFLSGRPVNVVN